MLCQVGQIVKYTFHYKNFSISLLFNHSTTKWKKQDELLSQLDRIKSRLMTIKNESIKTKVNVKTGGAY
jgi:hypothetical protein